MSQEIWYLYPQYKASGSGSWTDEDPADIQTTKHPSTPSCGGTGLYYSEDDGDDPQIRFRLGQVDGYSYNFETAQIFLYACGGDANQPRYASWKVGGDTYGMTAVSPTGAPMWHVSDEIDISEEPYNASVLNLSEIWLDVDDRNHRDDSIVAVYVKITGYLNIEEWDTDEAVFLGGCSGWKLHTKFGGVIFGGENQLENNKHRTASGGLIVGSLQPRYGSGGIEIASESVFKNTLFGNGGARVGGTAIPQHVISARGGLIIGGVTFENGFATRVQITVPASTESILGVLIGFPLYIPANFTTYQVEDDEGNILSHEVVSTDGNKISMFVKVNVRTEEQTIYVYGGMG